MSCCVLFIKNHFKTVDLLFFVNFHVCAWDSIIAIMYKKNFAAFFSWCISRFWIRTWFPVFWVFLWNPAVWLWACERVNLHCYCCQFCPRLVLLHTLAHIHIHRPALLVFTLLLASFPSCVLFSLFFFPLISGNYN